MKSIAFVLGLLLIAGCATSSTTSSPVNINGTWKGVYDSGGMDGQPPKLFIFNFKSDGDSLTGNGCDATTRPDEWIPLENGKIKGSNISFTSGQKNTKNIFEFKGKVDGDKVKMTYTVKQRGPNWWKPPRRQKPRPMIDDEGRQLRSGESILDSTRAMSVGLDSLNSLSGEFTIIRVK